MVLTSDGEVVTNHHVVAGATSIKVKVMSTGYDVHRQGGRHRHQGRRRGAAARRRLGARARSPRTPTAIAVGDAVTAVGDANGTVRLPQRRRPAAVLAEDQAITTQSEANVDRRAAHAG